MHNYFECCTYGTWIAKPTELLWAANRSLTLDQRQRILNGARRRPPLKIPHEVRVRGHFNAHPRWIAGGISALAVRGFPYFHHGVPAHMLTSSSRGLSHADSEARVSTVRKRFAPIREVDELLPELPVAPVPMAASQFLKDVSLQKYEWNVRPLGLLNRAELRVIQAADALCTFTRKTPERLLASMNEFLPVSVRVKRLVLKHCELGADSPPETWVRLLLKPLIPDLETQVKVADERGPIATADLGSRSLRIMIFYDGAYHSAADQREWDTEVNSRLTAAGYTVLRLSAQSIRNPGDIVARVRALVNRGSRARS
ncbi:MAG TPA: DUF559 domain-containing protein [Candidatus Corynebacterium intestinavium]|uniref:DUF559 domain-containing protein n=1 Tax=Candidatus Corynebacterium intestinavium TaxID=2838531 RepID=A0A9D2ZQU3_9CORY|nr:DUF559 domain-containing protein [Candidatus Corynebacterium intestinavium]